MICAFNSYGNEGTCSEHYKKIGTSTQQFKCQCVSFHTIIHNNKSTQQINSTIQVSIYINTGNH